MMRNVYQDPGENPFAFPQGRKLYTFSARYSEVWLFLHFHNFVSEVKGGIEMYMIVPVTGM